jgi:hypothetical protein
MKLLGLLPLFIAIQANADTLTIVPANPAMPPIVNAFPIDQTTGAMWIGNLTPLACQHYTLDLSTNGLAKQTACIPGPVDLTQWHGH